MTVASDDDLAGAALNKKSLAQQVYEVLEQLILSGKLPPGSPLAEETIAKQLSVSRSPVREAFAELHRVGLAERSTFHERRVLVPTKKFVSDLYDLWIVLLSAQIFLASHHATPEDIEEISNVLKKMKSPRCTKAEYAKLAERFSHLLSYRCENHLLNNIIDSHQKYLRWLAAVYYRGEAESSRDSHEEHLLIFDNFRNKDLTGLVTSLRAHVEHQRDKVLRQLTGE